MTVWVPLHFTAAQHFFSLCSSLSYTGCFFSLWLLFHCVLKPWTSAPSDLFLMLSHSVFFFFFTVFNIRFESLKKSSVQWRCRASCHSEQCSYSSGYAPFSRVTFRSEVKFASLYPAVSTWGCRQLESLNREEDRSWSCDIMLVIHLSPCKRHEYFRTQEFLFFLTTLSSRNSHGQSDVYSNCFFFFLISASVTL